MKTILLLPLAIFSMIILTLPLQAQPKEEASVMKIIDGDTLTIAIGRHKINVRLIGIDAPESRNFKKARQEAERTGEDLQTIIEMGREATKFVKSLIRPGYAISLEYDEQLRDENGLLLAYVYLRDGRMLNELIVKEGYAILKITPPNVKYKDTFLKAFKDAMDNKRGLW